MSFHLRLRLLLLLRWFMLLRLLLLLFLLCSCCDLLLLLWSLLLRQPSFISQWLLLLLLRADLRHDRNSCPAMFLLLVLSPCNTTLEGRCSNPPFGIGGVVVLIIIDQVFLFSLVHCKPPGHDGRRRRWWCPSYPHHIQLGGRGWLSLIRLGMQLVWYWLVLFHIWYGHLYASGTWFTLSSGWGSSAIILLSQSQRHCGFRQMVFHQVGSRSLVSSSRIGMSSGHASPGLTVGADGEGGAG